MRQADHAQSLDDRSPCQRSQEDLLLVAYLGVHLRGDMVLLYWIIFKYTDLMYSQSTRRQEDTAHKELVLS